MGCHVFHRLSPSDVSQTHVANTVSPMQSIWCSGFLRGWNCYSLAVIQGGVTAKARQQHSRPCTRPSSDIHVSFRSVSLNQLGTAQQVKQVENPLHFSTLPIPSRFSHSQIYQILILIRLLPAALRTSAHVGLGRSNVSLETCTEQMKGWGIFWAAESWPNVNEHEPESRILPQVIVQIQMNANER